MDHLGATQLNAWKLFLTMHRRIVDAIDHDMQASGHLPLSSYDVLIELQGVPGHRLRMTELAKRVVLSRSGLTRLVDRLEAEALLVRDRVDGDRRGAYAVMTDAGMAALRVAWPHYARGIETYFAAALAEDEMELLGKLLQHIAEHVVVEAGGE